ncbi:hypothetical protein DWX58_02560 [Pseudoflavonifractor sp. AF19-9AC]|uniref:hypothetical protein n=1 Tax=Pseudoflavonifractor sp. AF19-9AC TaxID=2292244 RepID=UPI000E4A7447|nr:hypothetical protein [Pseudoflavonifractor sp. AF19-9AC]RHR11342.1 hypothetical protein DWX58_02560 [Pseudoflavonifractor sp. AF19-9AC]
MKKQRKRLVGALIALLVLAAAVGTAGGRLAMPERLTGEDQFVGFHLVHLPVMDKAEPFQDRFPCTEYGVQEWETEEGDKVTLPQIILIGTYNEETRRYEFPGLEGFNCFFALRAEEDGELYYAGYADLSDVRVEVGEERNALSGTVYLGPQLEGYEAPKYGYTLTAYRVYQMEDGTVYITGEGDRQGYAGAGFTITEEHSRRENIGGKEQSVTLKVGFSTQWAERIKAVTVTWFGADDRVVGEESLSVEEIEDDLTLEPPSEAVWALVAVENARGEVERSSYTLEPGAAHSLVLLDERGLGQVVSLILS